MTLLLYRIGRACVRNRRRVLVVWIILAVSALGVGQASGGQTTDAFKLPGAEAQQALDVLEEDFPAAAGTSAQLVFAAETGTLSDPAAESAVEAALSDVAEQPDVGAVGELRRSADDRIGYAEVQYTRPSEDIRQPAFEHLEATAEQVNEGGDVQMELGGDLPSEAVQPEFGQEEMIGLAVAVVVLLVAFGSVIAMGLPIGLALLGLVTSLGFVTAMASVVDVITITTTLAAMLGIAAGIDYALFIVTRHRENLRQRMTVEEAAGRAVATSGSAVLFAGVTVVIAICGLALASIPFVTVMAVATALTVSVMVALSLTLLPALLGFAGHKIDSIRLPGVRARTGVAGRSGNGAAEPARETLWHRWGRQVSAHPWRYLALSTVVLVLLSAPVLSLRLGIPDNGNSPDSLTTRRAYDLVAEGFSPGSNGPLLLSVRAAGERAGELDPVLGSLHEALEADPGVAEVAPPQPNSDGTAAVLQVIPTTSPQDEATSELVHRLRDEVVPSALEATPDIEAYVGGQTAFFIDISDKVEARLLWFIGAVIVLSIVLLMTVFRSIAVPLKAAAMNLLSIGASYGIIVAVFQWGWLRDAFGVDETVPIISFLPMLLFAILFGLSMDYEVFLLSRVREAYLRHRDNDAAVIEGLSATARVITSAALIMISVFAGFVLSHDPVIKMFGLGLATAVFIDATLVRIVLVPATMKLLGHWNWWLPAWLDRRLPSLDIEGAAGLPEPELETPDDHRSQRQPQLVG